MPVAGLGGLALARPIIYSIGRGDIQCMWFTCIEFQLVWDLQTKLGSLGQVN